MLGTFVNAVAVIAGGFIGLLFGKLIKDSWVDTINTAMGIAIVLMGVNGAVSNMMSISADGKLSSSGELLLVVSLVFGGLVGEILKLNDQVEILSNKIEKKFKAGGFTQGFMNATAIFIVGAMAIMGPMEERLSGVHTMLYVKSLLDFVTAILISSTLGWGVIFASVPVVIYQGLFWLLAGVLEPFLSGGVLIEQICMVGYAILIAVGLNFMRKDNKIKTLNFLPSLLVPAIVYLIQGMF